MDKIIVLSGEDYIVFRELDVDNNHYIYAVALDSDKYTLLKERKVDDEVVVGSVTDRKEIEKVLTIIAQENI